MLAQLQKHKYLQRQLAQEARALGALGDAAFSDVLVIPSYGEGPLIGACIQALPTTSSSLVIVVVNEPADAAPHMREANAQSLRALYELGADWQTLSSTPRIHSAAIGQRQLVVVDRTGPAALTGGVGAARKIGMDMALALIARGQVAKPWIYCTDADATLPADYFQRDLDNTAVAAVLPFWHTLDQRQPLSHRPAELYELSLRYYVAGLHHAGSPYAMHTVGSTIVVRADAYAAVHGMPQREAAEDFYLLSKLAKLGNIMRVRGEPLRLQGRQSLRVPFGTGAAIHKLMHSDPELLFYHPTAFAYVGALTRALVAASHDSTGVTIAAITEAASHKGVDPAPLLSWAQTAKLAETTAQLAHTTQEPRALLKQFHRYCDPLKTLQLIHHVHRHGLGKVPWVVASQADFLPPEVRATETLTQQRSQLAAWEQHTTFADV